MRFSWMNINKDEWGFVGFTGFHCVCHAATHAHGARWEEQKQFLSMWNGVRMHVVRMRFFVYSDRLECCAYALCAYACVLFFVLSTTCVKGLWPLSMRLVAEERSQQQCTCTTYMQIGFGISFAPDVQRFVAQNGRRVRSDGKRKKNSTPIPSRACQHWTLRPRGSETFACLSFCCRVMIVFAMSFLLRTSFRQPSGFCWLLRGVARFVL